MTDSTRSHNVMKTILGVVFWIIIGLVVSIVFSIVTCSGNILIPHITTESTENNLSITLMGPAEQSGEWTPFSYRDIILVYNYYHDNPWGHGNKMECISLEYVIVEAKPEYDLSVESLLVQGDSDRVYICNIAAPQYTVDDISSYICSTSERRVRISESNVDDINIDWDMQQLIDIYAVYSIEPRVNSLAHDHFELLMEQIFKDIDNIRYPWDANS
ncbi:MAG: hypothetical protein ACTSWQ_10105 [Candidatus Thorarchaeota archaeon]